MPTAGLGGELSTGLSLGSEVLAEDPLPAAGISTGGEVLGEDKLFPALPAAGLSLSG